MENGILNLMERLCIPPGEEEKIIPSAFVKYDPIKKKSSDIEVAVTTGCIKKRKRRAIEKTIYEFLVLGVWNELLKRYSEVNDLKFRAPEPKHIIKYNNEEDQSSNYPVAENSLIMEFISGHELNKLNQVKRGTPVQLKDHKLPIPLYPACMYHIGALNQLKEIEGLFHSDYHCRHILFNFVNPVSMGVVDVENSRIETPSEVEIESKNMYDYFQRLTCSNKDKRDLQSWYNEGKNSLVIPDQTPQLNDVIDLINDKYEIKLDMANGHIDQTKIRVR